MIVDNVHIHIRTHSLLYEIGASNEYQKNINRLGDAIIPGVLKGLILS